MQSSLYHTVWQRASTTESTNNQFDKTVYFLLIANIQSLISAI